MMRHSPAGNPGRSSLSRRFLLAGGLVLAGTGAAAVAACGPKAPGATTDAKGLRGRIVFYARGNQVEQEGQSEILIPTFGRVAPNVEVVHEVFAASQPGENYTSKLYTMWVAGSPPDVWGFGQNYMAFWARNLLADLTPLIQRDKYDLDQFLTGLPDKFKVKGKYYGIPQLTTFGTLLFYNKSLFDEQAIKYPPVDWDDRSWTYERMVEVARRLTKGRGTAEAVYGLSYDPQMPTMAAWNFGGDAFLPEHYQNGIAPTTQLNSQASITGHEFLQDLRWQHHAALQTGKDPAQGINFEGGRLAMVVGGGWNFWQFTRVKDFRWAAAAIPWQVNNKNVNYNDFWELSSQSKHKEAAWAFIKHVAAPEIQQHYSRRTGTPPTTKAAVDVWYARYEGLMTKADLEKLTKQAIDPKRSQESPDHLFIDWEVKMDRYYSAEVKGPIDRNEGKPRDVIARAKSGYDAIVKEVYDQFRGKTPS